MTRIRTASMTFLILCQAGQSSAMFLAGAVQPVQGAFRANSRLSWPQASLTRHNLQISRIPQRTIINPTDLKNVDGIIDNSKKHLSPLNGVPLIETPYLQNIYTFANPDEPTTKVVTSLFHCLDGNLRTTQNKSLPGYSLNSELVADIIGHLENQTFNVQATQQKLIKEWQRIHKQQTGNHLSKTKTKILLDHIYNSYSSTLDHSRSLHIPYITQIILMSFLYRKSENKSELFDYLERLNQHIPVLKKQPNKISPDNYTAEELKEKEDQFISLSTQEKKNKIVTEYTEPIISAQLHKIRANSLFPPIVLLAVYGYKSQPVVPNCCETAMQDLCNMLLANPETKRFDLGMVPKNIQLHNDLKEFYTNYPFYASVNEQKIGQAWMNLVSDRPGIEYKEKNNYELIPDATNHLKLLNFLFNINATSWEELGELLSDERRTIKCKLVKRDTQEKLDIIEVSIIFNKEITPQIITMQVNPFHTSYHRTIENTTKQEWHDNILLDLNYAQSNPQNLTRTLLLRTLFGVSKNHNDGTFIPLAEKYHDWFGQQLGNIDELLPVLNSMLAHASTYPELLPSIKQIIEQLPNHVHFKRITSDLIFYHYTYLTDKYCAKYALKNISPKTTFLILLCALGGIIILKAVDSLFPKGDEISKLSHLIHVATQDVDEDFNSIYSLLITYKLEKIINRNFGYRKLYQFIKNNPIAAKKIGLVLAAHPALFIKFIQYLKKYDSRKNWIKKLHFDRNAYNMFTNQMVKDPNLIIDFIQFPEGYKILKNIALGENSEKFAHVIAQNPDIFKNYSFLKLLIEVSEQSNHQIKLLKNMSLEAKTKAVKNISDLSIQSHTAKRFNILFQQRNIITTFLKEVTQNDLTIIQFLSNLTLWTNSSDRDNFLIGIENFLHDNPESEKKWIEVLRRNTITLFNFFKTEQGCLMVQSIFPNNLPLLANIMIQNVDSTLCLLDQFYGKQILDRILDEPNQECKELVQKLKETGSTQYLEFERLRNCMNIADTLKTQNDHQKTESLSSQLTSWLTMITGLRHVVLNALLNKK